MSERAIREDPILIRPTTDEEIAYIASRAEEANLAAEAGDFGFMGEDTSEETAPEETSTEQEEVAEEQSGKVAGGSTVEGPAKELPHEEPPAPGKKKRVL